MQLDCGRRGRDYNLWFNYIIIETVIYTVVCSVAIGQNLASRASGPYLWFLRGSSSLDGEMSKREDVRVVVLSLMRGWEFARAVAILPYQNI
jgi:hypothetical protein